MSIQVLVVDDTKFMRAMLKDILVQFGYEVIGEAENGKQAVQMYEDLRPDVVLMDISMPEKDGISALKDMLQIDPDAVVLICSGMSQQDLISDAMKAGAKGYVMKPFKQNKIKEVITRYALPFIDQKKFEDQSPIAAATNERVEAAQPEPAVAAEPHGQTAVEDEAFSQDAQGEAMLLSTDDQPESGYDASEDAVAETALEPLELTGELNNPDTLLDQLPMITTLLEETVDAADGDLPQSASEMFGWDAEHESPTLEAAEIAEIAATTVAETAATETLATETAAAETAAAESAAAAEAPVMFDAAAQEKQPSAEERLDDLEELFAKTMHNLAEKSKLILEQKTPSIPSGAKVINLFRSDVPVKDFVSSYTCRWKEDVDGQAIGYLVTYTEGDSKISIETVGGKDGQEGMPLSYDSLKNLLTWLEPKLVTGSGHSKEYGKKAEM